MVKIPLGRLRHKWENNIEMEAGCELDSSGPV
jgi:hypothetical protein